MKPFDYAAATTVDEAVSLLAAGGEGARVLAGGTDLLVQLREGLRHAELIVDIKKIDELTKLDYSPERGLQLGAAVACYRIYGDPAIVAAYPALTDAARIIGAWQIQSRATVGGNLCNASPAADTIPALIASAATAVIAGPDGVRRIPVDQFCTGPGQNMLRRGEFLVSLELPPPQSGAGSAYLRFIPRNEMDIAVAGSGVWLRLAAAGDTIEAARIALAAVAPTPVVAQQASDYLIGKPATPEHLAQAGELAKQAASPITDRRGPAEYRLHLVGVLTKRALATAVERARAT